MENLHLTLGIFKQFQHNRKSPEITCVRTPKPFKNY